jgi:hypothetical protein
LRPQSTFPGKSVVRHDYDPSATFVQKGRNLPLASGGILVTSSASTWS